MFKWKNVAFLLCFYLQTPSGNPAVDSFHEQQDLMNLPTCFADALRLLEDRFRRCDSVPFSSCAGARSSPAQAASPESRDPIICVLFSRD